MNDADKVAAADKPQGSRPRDPSHGPGGDSAAKPWEGDAPVADSFPINDVTLGKRLSHMQ